jgi:hypothetical protein
VATKQIQSKRILIARYGAVARTCEAYSGAGKKRLEAARPIVLGDGQSQVLYLFDPAVGCDQVTLRFIVTRDDPFVQAAGEAFERHRRDPQSAESLVLMAYTDAGAVVASKTLVRAVIQEMRWPEGDTNTNNESMLELIVQPTDALAA